MSTPCFLSPMLLAPRISAPFPSSSTASRRASRLAPRQTPRAISMDSKPAAPTGASGEDAPDLSTHSTCRPYGKGSALNNFALDTRLVHGGSHPEEWTTDPLGRSVVNPPVYHASTISFPTAASIREAQRDWPFLGISYGRHGNPTTFALEEAFAVMEGAENACLTASGVAAMNVSILAFVKAGDHVLLTDGAYEPSRLFCFGFLKRFGVETTVFSPLATPEELEKLVRPGKTKVLVVESPSSLSFEIMDIAAFAEVAHNHGAKVICDNTWGPTLFRPFDHGCDVSLNAATKYLGGHSDLMMGITSARDYDTYRTLKKSVAEIGCPPGSDDAYLALRGLRTLGVRIKQQGATGLEIARWLERRPEVARVMHPGLPSHPQHALFMKQFSGSCGLFGLQLVEKYSRTDVDAMMDGLKLYSMGFSWGGYESLIMQTSINAMRSVEKWKYGDGFGLTLRIHVGLEDAGDLIMDLANGFDILNASCES